MFHEDNYYQQADFFLAQMQGQEAQAEDQDQGQDQFYVPDSFTTGRTILCSEEVALLQSQMSKLEQEAAKCEGCTEEVKRLRAEGAVLTQARDGWQNKVQDQAKALGLESLLGMDYASGLTTATTPTISTVATDPCAAQTAALRKALPMAIVRAKNCQNCDEAIGREKSIILALQEEIAHLKARSSELDVIKAKMDKEATAGSKTVPTWVWIAVAVAVAGLAGGAFFLNK